MWTSRLPAAAAATALAPHIGLRKAFAATVSTTSHQAAIFTPSSLCLSSSPSRYSPDRCWFLPLGTSCKGDSTDLLSTPRDGTSAETVKSVVEMANRVLLRSGILYTDFLTPPLLRESMLALEKLADIKVVPHGGYPEAERCRISVGHLDVTANDAEVVAVLSITGTFKFKPCNHGDFLGQFLALGSLEKKLEILSFREKKEPKLLLFLNLLISSSLPLIRLVMFLSLARGYRLTSLSMRHLGLVLNSARRT